MMPKEAFANMKERLFGLLDRYPEEMREIIMTPEDKANVAAAAFFTNEVVCLEKMDPTERAEVVMAYIETIWMAGYEAGHKRSR
ncbi:MAG: hypothetical protein HND46_23445 [Chloroflexi bacterium]|nr:hypothetical protein [Chloroflexota bacterium]